LIYNVDVQDQGKKVDVDMTLDDAGVPGGPQIIEQARREIGALRDVYADSKRSTSTWSGRRSGTPR